MNQASVMAQPQQGTLRMRKDSTDASLALVETLEAISRRAISGTLYPRRHLASPVVYILRPTVNHNLTQSFPVRFTLLA